MLLVVAESSGSSPGRAGYKMAIAADGGLCGSIGGGVMEVNLVEQSRGMLSAPSAVAGGASLIDQVHQKNSANASGMICSGRQTIIRKLLIPSDASRIEHMIAAKVHRSAGRLRLTHWEFQLEDDVSGPQISFECEGKEFAYIERLGRKDTLIIIGGGHCALALSELMSKLSFSISIYDDRPELNTLAKNHFADEITVIGSYETIADHIPEDQSAYTVVMTLGYASDKVVIKQLCGRDFKYFGVLGSKSKMATLMRELREEGVPDEQLAGIRTPIGITINSRTPEEIAVSIAAEIIAVKNEAEVTSPRSPRAIRSR